MALAARHLLTTDEFLARADQLPPHAQLIDGEVIVCSPSFRHQHMLFEICHRLRLWIDAGVDRGWCGFQLDVRIDDHNLYEPDAWWCSEKNRPSIEVLRLTAPPDIAVEVLSPSTRHYDLGAKRARYEAHGLAELWIIDPQPSADPVARILRRSTADVVHFDVDLALDVDGVFASPQLPGFSLPLADLFG